MQQLTGQRGAHCKDKLIGARLVLPQSFQRLQSRLCQRDCIHNAHAYVMRQHLELHWWESC